MDPDLGDFRDYGVAHDWTSVSLGVGYPGADESATWLPKRVAQFRPAGIFGDLPDGGSAQATRYDPYEANDEQRFQIALVLQTIGAWVGGCAGCRPLRLLTSGAAGTGKSFVIHALTELVRKLLGFPGAAMVYAPTGVAAFQLGRGSAGRIPLQPPTGKKAVGQLEPSKGESLRKVQGNLSRCALLIGDERGAIRRAMLGRQEYNTGFPPISREAHPVAPWR